MLTDLYVIYEGGQLMFSWHKDKANSDEDHVTSGFLTAIDTFAASQRGEGISSLKLDMTSLIFDKDDELKIKFVIIIKEEKSIELLYSVLEDIKQKFIKKYKPLIKDGYFGNISELRDFKDDLQTILQSLGIRYY
ncbi:MAG: hypothetical protein ACTSPY_09640 [Candidatus Helarchaeota archaeon]